MPPRSQLPLSPSSYRFFVPSSSEKQFRKIDKDNPHSRLHSHFWGEPLSKFRSETESVNIGVHEEREGYCEDTGEDEDKINAGDYDYILNVGLPGRVQVFIRKEYIRFYNYCNAHLAGDNQTREALSVVITGQPGIGECSFASPYGYRGSSDKREDPLDLLCCVSTPQ